MENLSLQTAVTLSNGVKIPLFGLSTEEIGLHVFSHKTQVEMLCNAIALGYRYFDTAETHGINRALGEAIRKSGLPRESFFISSKMRIDEMGDGRYYQAIDETLCQLEMDYLDLYSIHWPLSVNRQWPKVPAYVGAYVGREISKTDNGDAEGLLSFYKKGLTRAIGVCNFEVHHLKTLLANPKCLVKPMINQSHFHPLHACPELRRYCAVQGIVFGGLFEESELEIPTKPRFFTDVNRYGLLFQTDDEKIQANSAVRVPPERRSVEYQPDPYARDRDPRRKKDYYDDFDVVREIAAGYGKTNTQLLIRWSLQHGVITTPRAMTKKKMQEQMDVFDFIISDADMDRLDRFHIGLRVGYHPDYIDF